MIANVFEVVLMTTLALADRSALRTAAAKAVVRTVSVKMVSVVLRTRACEVAAMTPTALQGNAALRMNAFSPALRMRAAATAGSAKQDCAKMGVEMIRAAATTLGVRTTNV